MARIIPADGPSPCDILVIGERPGGDEYEHYVYDPDDPPFNFIGKAGAELWSRLDRVCGLTRRSCRVANLVPTFSKDAPSDQEIAQHAWRIDAEIRRTRPRLIITIGYHAARYLLPQFRGINGDYFHGLAFDYPYGRLSPRWAVLVPCVHSAAALREPELYQHQFTDDLRSVRRVWDALQGAVPVACHSVRRPAPYHVGLASVFARLDPDPARAGVLGLDTEGSVTRPECISLSTQPDAACALDLTRRTLATAIVQQGLDDADRIAIHYAKRDWAVLRTLGLELPSSRVDCTMLMAYELGLPQSLKVLSYRLLGYLMSEYDDLIQPIDDTLVRSTLEAAYGRYARRLAAWRRLTRWTKTKAHTRRRTAGASRGTDGGGQSQRDPRRVRSADRRSEAREARTTDREASQDGAKADAYRESRSSSARAAQVRDGSERIEAQDEAAVAEDARAIRAEAEGQSADGSRTRNRDRKAAHSEGREGTEGAAQGQGPQPPFPPRLVSSLHRAIGSQSESPLRKRWSSSVYGQLVPLPPAPTWRDLPASERVSYAMTDALAHRDVHGVLSQRIIDNDVSDAYAIDRAILPFLVRNEQIGLKVNTAAIPGLSQRFSDEYDAACAELARIAGHPVNPNASEDVSDTLFRELGVRPTRLTKTGYYTTGKKYLKARELEHVAVPLVMHARHLTKLRGTYVDKLPGMLRDGRYHPDWKYTRTTTGRLAETIILLIPKHSPLAPLVRNLFIADTDHVLVSCDLSQIEMRVMAHESQDELLLDLYARGGDVHADTAHHLLGAPKGKENQDESKHRLPSKTLNFGIIMQMTEYGLLEQLHSHRLFDWTLESCRDFIKEWYVLHKGCDAYRHAKQSQARRLGYVTDMWGARSYVEGIWSTEERIAAASAREAAARPIQSAASRISKLWNARIYRDVIEPRIRDGRRYCEPWNWIHDDTILECDTRIQSLVMREMLERVPDVLDIPTLAEGKVGAEWGNLGKAAA